MEIKKRYGSQQIFSITHNGTTTEGKHIGHVLADFAEVQAVGCDGAINGVKWGTAEAGDPTTRLKVTFETIDDVPYLVVRSCDDVIVFQIAGEFVAGS